jgi:hypothetical protein
VALTDAWKLPGFAELEQLGEGTFGRVVLARQENTGHVVAIKYLFSRFAADPAQLSAFRQEAMALHRVVSPHVVRLYEFFETPQGAAIVMEAINGVSLRSVLQSEGVLEPEAALAVLKGSLLGLAAAHAANVVHRDYKPGNVLVSDSGESKLVDFGTAVLAGEWGANVGTPAYMAPEQWAGGVATPATDVYAATCVFFQCVAGHRPYQAEDTEVLRTLHEHAPVPFGEAPEPVHEIVALGMAKDPAKRPIDALTFVGELERVARAGYGDEWERKGWSRLAKASGVLAAVTPLVLLGSGTAAAPGVAAAGTGAVATSTGGIAAGLKIAAGVVAATAAVLGSVVVFSDSSSPPQPPPATTQAVALKVAVKTRTGTMPGSTIGIRGDYPEVSGSSDQAWLKRVNDALAAPIDEWTRETGPGAAQLEPERGPYVLTTKVDVRMQNERYLSVRYEHGLDNAPHPTWLMGRSTVLIDLTSGTALAPADLFRPGMFSDQGMLALSDRLWPDHDQGCALKDWNPIVPADLTGPGERKVFPSFTPSEVELTINFNRLGFETACGVQTVKFPYDKLADLLNPDLVAGLTGGKTVKGSSSAPTSASVQGLTDVSVGALTLHLPQGWSVRPQGLEKVIVDSSCPDPAKYFNCKYFLITDNTTRSAEQPPYRPGGFYRRSAGGRACNAAGRKDLRQEGDAVKTVSATAPVGGATAVYEEWTIQCVPRGQTGGSGEAQVTQRIWFVADRQLVVMDEWGTPGVEELLRTATVR